MNKFDNMKAPTMRGEIKKQFGEQFNGGLMYAKIDEMKSVLNGTMQPDVLARTLKARARKRQRDTGIMPGKQANRPPMMGRKAATSIPRKPAKRVELATVNVLSLAATLAAVKEFASAPAQLLHAAVDSLCAARGQS